MGEDGNQFFNYVFVLASRQFGHHILLQPRVPEPGESDPLVRSGDAGGCELRGQGGGEHSQRGH